MNQKYQFFNFMLHVLQNAKYSPKWSYQKEPFLESDQLHDLSFDYSLLHGISRASCKHLFSNFISGSDNNLHGMIVVKDGKTVFEAYHSPYRKEYRHVSHSMCKSVTGMALGLAIDDKKIQLSTKLSDIFPEYSSQKNAKELERLTIYHLLTMQAGVCFHEVSQAFCSNWVKEYMHSDFIFSPGEKFYYNSMNSYMLCAVLSKIYGESVISLLKRRIFDPLHIYDITWDRCPMGIEKGGYGMKLSLQDMAKLGILYMNHGMHIDVQTGRHHQLLSEQYVSEATSVQTSTNNQGFDYGYHCWIMEDGFLFNGMFGQNVYVFPKQKLVIATQGGTSCFLPNNDTMTCIRNFVYPENKKIHLSNHSITDTITRIPSAQVKKQVQTEFMSEYMGKTYELESPIPSVLPFFMQLFYLQVTSGMDRIHFYHKYPDTKKKRGSCPFMITMQSKEEMITLEACCGKSMEQHVFIHGQTYPLCVSCDIAADNDIYHMLLRVDFLEEANSRIYEIDFKQHNIHVKSRELPSLEYLSSALLEKDMIALYPVASRRHLPKHIQNKINKIIKPDTYGFEK